MCEDWSMLSGGSSGKKYRSQPHKWTHKFWLRRPTFFNVYVYVAAAFFNTAARCVWMIGWLLKNDVTKSFWYETLIILVEVIRRCIWNVFRLDNQQQTNCEDYVVCKFIPVMPNELERDAQLNK